ncbi:MAG TPA: hypothetical protein VNS19_22155 [Acidimicrobiales bacterium]|jgi:hypothetical protein|nr:hypothetical protein [Acidimicrobiales bacterium]
MQRVPRDCVWCDQSGPTTVEDVIAQWIARLFQERFWPQTPNFAIRRPGRWHDEDLPSAQPAKRIKIDLKVCATCNNGWMSQLETRVKPVLSDLIFAEDAVAVSQSDADTLAAWSAKTLTNAVFERHRRADRLVPPGARDLIRQQQVPTPDMAITAFRVDGLDTKVRTRVSDVPLRKPGGRQIGVAVVSTLLIGRVAVRMVYSTHARSTPALPAPLRSTALPLWPTSSRPNTTTALTWPKRGIPGEDALETICDPSEAEVATWYP